LVRSFIIYSLYFVGGFGVVELLVDAAAGVEFVVFTVLVLAA